MSRYEIEGRQPGTKVFVGWDHPLLTYFVQVYDEPSEQEGPEQEGPRVWLGASLREIYDLTDLKRAIRPHADLSLELGAVLYRDRDEGR